MTSQERKVMELALEALEEYCKYGAIFMPFSAITTIKEALAQPEQVSPMSEPNRAIAYAASSKLHELGYRYLDGKWVQPKEPEQKSAGWFKYDHVSECWHPQYENFVDRFAKEQNWQQLYFAPPQRKPLTEWQPIDTAPFNTNLLVISKTGYVHQNYRSKQYANTWTHWMALPDAPIEAAHGIKE